MPPEDDRGRGERGSESIRRRSDPVEENILLFKLNTAIHLNINDILVLGKMQGLIEEYRNDERE